MESCHQDPALPPELGKVLLKITEAMTRMQDNQRRSIIDFSRVSIHSFLKLKARTFDGSGEPLEAEYWIREKNRAINIASVAQQDRVLFATRLLLNHARYWWESYQQTQDPDAGTTWEEFQTVFKMHHIPETIVERKCEEFLQLTEGNKSCLEYRTIFNHLACYAKEEVFIDAKRQEKFRKGLKPELKYALNLFKCSTFAELVNMALKEEYGREVLEHSRKHLRDNGSTSSTLPPHKCRIWVPFGAPAPPTYMLGRSTYIPRPPAPTSF
uniref:Uncharacterized protein n=1 Tax=Avena sativa TaxID=4498 RepID=A0ACD6AJL8_AVESA